MFAPQTSDLLEKLALNFLYNFYRKHNLLKLEIKRSSPKINVKKHTNWSLDACLFVAFVRFYLLFAYFLCCVCCCILGLVM